MLRRFGVLTLLSVYFGHCHAQDTIYWQTYHLPPILIKTGPETGQGFIDKTLDMIIERMPQYKHELPLTSHTRALENIRHGNKVCHPSLYRTPERMEFAHFSIPSIVTPSHRLIMKKETATKLSLAETRIDMDTLYNDSSMSIILIQSRSYGAPLDALLKTILHQNIVEVSPTKADINLKLVASGRLETTIAYPYEVTYFNRKNQNKTGLVPFLINGIPAYSTGTIACPKNPWGKQIIDEIDTILREIRQTPEYIQAMTTWWEQEVDKPGFQAKLNETFGPQQP